jgi:hypothetical protein
MKKLTISHDTDPPIRSIFHDCAHIDIRLTLPIREVWFLKKNRSSGKRGSSILVSGHHRGFGITTVFMAAPRRTKLIPMAKELNSRNQFFQDRPAKASDFRRSRKFLKAVHGWLNSSNISRSEGVAPLEPFLIIQLVRRVEAM